MIRIQTEDFDVSEETKRLRKDRTDVGAIVSFTGTVRQTKPCPPSSVTKGQKEANKSSLLSLTLEHYPGMSERELQRIEGEARQRWSLLDCLIIHRTGELFPGDNIVLVLTLSRHRQDAFEAASFLMDYLKTSAPFWKKEKFSTHASWVKARTQDEEAAKSWEPSDVVGPLQKH